MPAWPPSEYPCRRPQPKGCSRPAVHRWAPAGLPGPSWRPSASLACALPGPLFRARAREFYVDRPGRDQVLQADDAARALALCQSHNPALILLETLLPGLDVYAAAADMRQLRPGAKIGILTRHNQPALLTRARRGRLNGFVLKQDGFEELSYAIRTMLKGGFYTPPSMSSVLVEPTLEADPMESLTPRERSVFSLYAQGYGNRSIADTLNISVKTSETHLTLWLELATIHTHRSKTISGLPCLTGLSFRE